MPTKDLADLVIPSVVICIVILSPSLSTSQRVTPMTEVSVCQGDDVPLRVSFENSEGDILKSILFKKEKHTEFNLMEKEAKKAPISHNIRVLYLNPTGVILRNAVANDSGTYELHVVFENNKNAWHIFKVTVSAGCPDKAKFYRPAIQYKLKESANWELLPSTNDIQLKQPYADSKLILNVNVPKAQPPIILHCDTSANSNSIITAKTSVNATLCVFVVLKNDIPDNLTIAVRLGHATLTPPSRRTIRIYIPDQEAEQTLESIEYQNQRQLWIVIVIPLLAVAGVIGIIVCICRIRKDKFRNCVITHGLCCTKCIETGEQLEQGPSENRKDVLEGLHNGTSDTR